MLRLGPAREVPTFDEYVAAAWPSLFRMAYLLTGNHADAEDVAQQALERGFRAWSRVSAADSPDAYMRRVLVNTFLESRRPARVRREVLTEAAPERPAAAEGFEDRMMLLPHVRSLPPRQRAVLMLRYYEDLSEQQTAEALGCSVGTVKSTAHAALRSLRAVLVGLEEREA